ncbi:protocadherin alpha-8-like isoform X12 [Denticeps clupeoides]|uniref:protocadherin alpha-8-like isoform X12 n=1 Tax=Denticeps clupeoides TaxID=299321 RepID=UPI0010A4F6B6|nr:protocadherin alpha-8-like isoform X12 [Denticeps clupeoides]
MEQRGRESWRKPRQMLVFVAALLLWRGVTAQVRYSVAEEQTEGAAVGNVAKDLGLDARTLKDRDFRVVSSSNELLFSVNQDDGVLHVTGKIDREEVCERSGVCLISLKAVLEKPLEIHYVEVEVVDVNDHAPGFPEREVRLEMSESALPGARFQLQPARDPDGGTNSVQLYKLSSNDHFRLEVKDRGVYGKIPTLILQKSLDRETAATHTLVLTAFDGGKPQKSGTTEITVDVLDINDNPPVFNEDVYSVTLNENSPIGTTVITVNATDLDEGSNGEVTYSFGHSDDKTFFDLNAVTGEIVVKGHIDFEEKDKYELDIQASDKGSAPLTADKTVIIRIVDVNDNAPEIEVTSFSSAVPEDSRPGTTVALVILRDLDSGDNGRVSCSLRDELPFKLSPSVRDNVYSLVTKSLLDREKTSRYDVTVVAKDAGQPPLSSARTISVTVTDVNDNSPEFSSSPYTFYVPENNVPGELMFSVSAFDADLHENSLIQYHVCRDCAQENEYAHFVSVNSENGNVHGLKSFDFETTKTFQFHVAATDGGAPPRSTNVTVLVFILDRNDNAPVILSPVSANGSSEVVEEIPRNVNAGHLVTKLRAVDADVGYNAWLLFSLKDVSDHTLFGLDRYTGQVRTLRSFTETDEAEHKLIILVKDNGNVSLSATATVIVKSVEPKEAFAASDVDGAPKLEDETAVTYYLYVALGSVSVLFLVSVVVLTVMQCSKSPDCPAKYLQEANYDGTLCHSIQYRSGDKRYMLVGPRMSIGSTIVPGSNGNTLIVPDRRRRLSGEDCVYPGWILQHRASQAHSHTGMHADG